MALVGGLFVAPWSWLRGSEAGPTRKRRRVRHPDAVSYRIPRFARFVECGSCGFKLGMLTALRCLGARWEGCRVHAPCLGCGEGSPGWTIVDVPREGEFVERSYSTDQISTVYDPFADKVKYLWKIPDDLARRVREGFPFVVSKVPAAVIYAVRDGKSHILLNPAVHTVDGEPMEA
jgi:hypothetical protein